MPALKLPHADGRLEAFELSSPAAWRVPSERPQWNRVAFAAAHVVAAPLAAIDPWLDTAIDWDATLAYRRHLWSLGFGVAEAMDTAQRGRGRDCGRALAVSKRPVADAGDLPWAGAGCGSGRQ